MFGLAGDSFFSYTKASAKMRRPLSNHQTKSSLLGEVYPGGGGNGSVLPGNEEDR